MIKHEQSLRESIIKINTAAYFLSDFPTSGLSDLITFGLKITSYLKYFVSLYPI
jgi:hypothetical protein